MWLSRNVSSVLSLTGGFLVILFSIRSVNATSEKLSLYDNFINDDPVVQQRRVDLAKNGQFSDDFLLGVASSAYQTEGAWNVSDKGVTTWDHYIKTHPETIADGTDGSVASDFYHKYKEDIGLLKDIGAISMRISIAWSRVLPNGFSNYVSKEGIDFYNNVINEMISNNIEPLITMFHFDLPQKIEDLGGWSNPLIVDWFVDYARVLFQHFGDRVKIWATINEPMLYCVLSYGGAIYPPILNQSGVADYLCGHHSLLAHAKVYKMYKEEFKPTQNGIIGIMKAMIWPLPADPNEPDEVSGVERFYQFGTGWFLQPIFGATGDYPEIMRQIVKARSEAQGFRRSRLPEFSAEQIEMIKGSADFLGVNFYKGHDVKSKVADANEISYLADIGTKWRFGITTMTFDQRCQPKVFRDLLIRINTDYNIPMILITENGYFDNGGRYDYERAKYFHQHLSELPPLIASGVNIRGYYAWTLCDSFEWHFGYTIRYGLYEVDFNNTKLPRSPKLSSTVVSGIYKSKRITNFDDCVKEFKLQTEEQP